MSTDKKQPDFLDEFLLEEDTGDSLNEMFDLLEKDSQSDSMDTEVDSQTPEEPVDDDQTPEQETGNGPSEELQPKTEEASDGEPPAVKGDTNSSQETKEDKNPSEDSGSHASDLAREASGAHQKDAAEEEKPESIFDAALKKARNQEIQRILDELKAQNPVFSFGRVNDPIADPEMTFDNLRRQYEVDFNDLEDPKRVRWSVRYGKSIEYVTNPDTKIYDVKAKMEASKKFQEALLSAKTDKDKKPECIVKCTVLGNTKGTLTLPPYKGFYPDWEEAKQSQKAIILVPAKDGSVYEIRNNEIGSFTAPADHLPEFYDLTTGFQFKLPKIPFSLLKQTIAFFRLLGKQHMEALIHIVFDTKAQTYFIYVPKQTVTGESVHTDGMDYGDDRILVMEIHSHHGMPARFSSIDDKDEKALRLYAVVGRINQYFPEISVRASCNGTYIPLMAGDVFDSFIEESAVPPAWRSQVAIDLRPSLPCESSETAGGGV